MKTARTPAAPLAVATIDALLTHLVAHWHDFEVEHSEEGLRGRICDLHRFNFLLWHEEDIARSPQVTDGRIAQVKRAIDRYNQARNDATGRVDELLLLALGVVDEAAARSQAPLAQVAAGARLNSETAGSMIDRLSILSLKLQAMAEQTRRGDVDEAHRAGSRQKWERLAQQRADLAGCLDALLAETAAGKAFFKVYRQFKMYNDPDFNPELVKERRRQP